ncbi:unnamed protein product [Pedinophyceae sp. YPF-701]|nr:unnamed protein product [Pedinophyceae sp. YPF-701]
MALCLSLYAAMQCEEALSADSGSQHGADVHVWFGRLDGLIEAAERVLDTLAHSFSSGRPEAMRNTGRAVLALARELSRIEEGLSGVDCRAVEPARKAVHILMGHFVLFGLKRAPTQLVGDVARSSLEEARTQLQDDRLAVAQESVHGGTSPPRWSGRRLAPVVPRQTRQA